MPLVLLLAAGVIGLVLFKRPSSDTNQPTYVKEGSAYTISWPVDTPQPFTLAGAQQQIDIMWNGVFHVVATSRTGNLDNFNVVALRDAPLYLSQTPITIVEGTSS